MNFDRRLFERGYDVIVTMREAQRSEPDLDAAYQEGRRRGRQGQSRMFDSWPADALREGVTPERASDIFAALCNVDVYRVLTQERGWTPDQVEEWWREALTALLLRWRVPLYYRTARDTWFVGSPRASCPTSSWPPCDSTAYDRRWPS